MSQQINPQADNVGAIKKGHGGETHQIKDGPKLTTDQGYLIDDNQNSLTVGERGPVSLDDFQLREKIFNFDHERIPERVVHARGYGAHGYFESYDDWSKLTKASLFSAKGKKTETFVRFSTVAGNKGSPDLARDVRGFAVKFYTDEGNWDLVGNNIPVFFIQDGKKFPDLIHAAKQEPDRGFPQAQTAHDNFWDFISLMPEAMHMIMWTMSDRSLPRSFRTMEGFGVHSFKFINAAGKTQYVKFHWKPMLGLQSVTWDEAVKINGADPDFHRRDLWNAIDKGDYPEWELGVQIFDDEFADSFDFDILDATKLIPEEHLKIVKLGKLVLNRNVDNFFAETEQVAFCTQNIVPGLDFTNDPLLQSRNFSYLDTQLKRLGGPNFKHIPVNQPRCPFHNFTQDGHMQTMIPKGRANYEPNSWPSSEHNPSERYSDSFVEEQKNAGTSQKASSTKRRIRPESFADHYSQARLFYNSQTDTEREHIQAALNFELSKVTEDSIRHRLIGRLKPISPDLFKRVCDLQGVSEDNISSNNDIVVKDIDSCDSLSILKSQPKSFKGRKLGLLVSEGFSDNLYQNLLELSKSEGFDLSIISKTIEPVSTDKGTSVTVDEALAGAPSVMFDSVALAISEEKLIEYQNVPKFTEFLNDAYDHKKYIAYHGDANKLFETYPFLKGDDGFHLLSTSHSCEQFVAACSTLRFWDRRLENKIKKLKAA